jgi:beta-N-acetylhexosaminidase
VTEQEVRQLVAEVMVLRNSPQWRTEDNALIQSGAVLHSQIGGADIRVRAAELRDLSPGQLTLQSDLETGSSFAEDGLKMPPLMALGATGSEELAYDWGRAIGLEGRRLGLDLTWSPVLDVNTNPDNPIINVRAFGEDADLVGRLGAAVTRGIRDADLEPCAKHWPGHGDVAVDSHISLPTVEVSRERLETIDWAPYRAARQAGLESVMTGHLLVPAIDPDNCGTVSPTLIGILRNHLDFPGPIITDSLGMEGLRLTLDSAEAAWRALAAGHDQVLVDYKRPPGDSVEATVAACMDGRVPEGRLREAVACVRRFKARRLQVGPLPADDQIRQTMVDTGTRIAQASLTLHGDSPTGNLGARPLLIVCDDLERYGVDIAAEKEGKRLEGEHPLARLMPAEFNILIFDESPTAEQLAQAKATVSSASAVVAATFARIMSYKGDGVRLPQSQVDLWRQVADTGKLAAMLLFESPYALTDLPAGRPTIIGYGGDGFTLQAAVEALLDGRPCPGRLPVTVMR